MKVLAIIDECVRLINDNPAYPNMRNVYELPLDDSKTYEMLASGDVLG